MVSFGDDNTMIKIAVFGITMSILVTAMVTFLVAGSSDYDYDTIKGYQNDLVEFSGDSMLNETPWILSHVYTPFNPAAVADEDIPNHTDEAGWLFGADISDYAYIGEAANIKLDPAQKSNQKLSVGDPYSYSYQAGREWWNGGNDIKLPGWETGVKLIDPTVAQFITGGKSGDGYVYKSGVGNNWNYSGVRYVFDPSLPFSTGANSKDGQLSIVWYNYDNQTGLSGGLDIYGAGHKFGESPEATRLSSIDADDIIRSYQTSSGYATIYDFDFNGIHLNLSVKFSPTVLQDYPSLRAAWDAGAWSMAISSASAGNFFDVENSNSFANSAGSMIDTFIQIFTFSYPEFEEPWVNVILWLMVGLPMTMGMLLMSMRLVGGVFKFF